MIKVISNQGSPNKTTSTIELDVEAPPKVLAKIREEVGDFLVETILSDVADAKSPVAGESFPKLSKDYKKLKVSEGGSPVPNMELSGEMLDSLTHHGSGSTVEVGFFDEQAWKADGHLKFSGEKNATPKRRFLPAEGQHFKSGIEREVEKIIADNLVEAADLKKSDLAEISTKSELYEVLSDKFEGMSRSEIKSAILRIPELTELLDDLDLLEML